MACRSRRDQAEPHPGHMALIDTSGWVEYLRRTGSPVNTMVRELLAGRGEAFVTDVVVAEVLMGARDEAHAGQLRRMLNRCTFVPTRPLFDFEQASAIYRTCRRGGHTPRSLADCLVAAVAIDRNLQLLHADRDFERMAEHVPLALVGD